MTAPVNEPQIVAAPGISAREGQGISTPTWRQSLRDAIRDPAELCRILELPPEFEEQARRAAEQFPLLAPREYVARIRKGDPADPLLRQILPLDIETATTVGFEKDAVGDGAATAEPGLLIKYRGRALLLATGACAIHCRYCFRRHYPYDGGPRSVEQWRPAIEHIESDETLHEVILSGGDPLTLVDATLDALAHRLAEIPHVRRLRVHSRLPIVIPQRVTPELIGWMRGTRLAPIMVVHANHPAELDKVTAKALGRLVDEGIPVLNQAVLLKGVNDSAETLIELCERLVDLRVQPYYLHQLDRVTGAAHFEVPVEFGLALMEIARRRLPGYAVPRYVREVAGRPYKVELTAEADAAETNVTNTAEVATDALVLEHDAFRPGFQLPEELYGVPRSFGIGTLVIGSTAFCLLLGLLKAYGAPTMAIVFVTGLVTIVALAQMLLFKGKQPRKASIVAGIAYASAIALVGSLADLRYRLGPWSTVGHILQAVLYVVFASPFGAMLGYLAGGIVAGIFLCLDYLDRWLHGDDETDVLINI